MQIIQHTELGSAQASIDFTSIPNTFTDLLLVCSLRCATSTSAVVIMTFNNNASSYSWRRLIGDGSNAFSDNTASSGNIRVIGSNPSGSTASTFGNTQFYIPNYASSNNKSVSVDGVRENNATSAEMNIAAGLWSNTTAINQITLSPDSGNWAAGSSATLYGILKGSAGGVTVS